MSTLKVIANGIALDFIKETLTLKRENNAMIRDFRINYSTNPFLVVENKDTAKALGPRDIKSVNKKTVVPVFVYEADVAYYGELQVISCLKGYRKCNLKYATELISIMNRKIAEFMPTVSVIPGVSNPDPYVEESDALIPGYTNWNTYPLGFIDEVFPNAMWQFPTLFWRNRFGVDLDVNDPWYEYQNEINKFNSTLTSIIENTYDYDGSGNLFVHNKNVVSPQVHLLSPLFFALNELGWKASGNFYTDEFVRRLLILNSKHNMTKVKLFGADTPIDFGAVSWVHSSPGTLFENYNKTVIFPVSEAGTYTFTFEIVMNGPFNNHLSNYFAIAAPGDSAVTPVVSVNYLFETSHTYSGVFEMVASSAGNFILFLSVFRTTQLGSITVSVRKNEEKYFQQPNPTIELGRYVPDWTFGTYLNELKNFFNLDIEIDDFTKTMNLNFFDETLINEVPLQINSLLNESFDLPTTQAFWLKYQNDVDASAWITASGALAYSNQTSDYLEKLESKFKIVPNNLYTANLSEELFDKEGVGLMIYNELNRPNIAQVYNGQNLSILGAGGIYETYWRNTLKFRLNASVVEVEGYFSKTQLAKALKANLIYLNNQEFIIESISYAETKDGNFSIQFKIHSKTL